MSFDNKVTIVLIILLVASIIGLKLVQKMHARDPHFAEEEERRREEYKRRTIEANREKELKQALDEGYSYGGIDEDGEDDETEDEESEEDNK